MYLSASWGSKMATLTTNHIAAQERKRLKRLKVNVQGKIVVEEHGMYDWLVMFPSGRIERFRNKSEVERVAKQYFARRAKKAAINAGLIEWRDKR